MSSCSIAVDQLSRDALAVARLLKARGHSVTIHGSENAPGDLAELVASAIADGIVVKPRSIDTRAAAKVDVLLVDLSDTYTPPSAEYIRGAREQGVQVTCLSDVVFRLRRTQTLGVTGSAGKSTTTLLCAHILRSAEFQVTIPHNIRMENPYPNYELIDALSSARSESWIVAEITSAHLEYMRSSPTVAVVTTLSPDHGDWHGSIDRYFEAKCAIVRHQTREDWAVLNNADPTSMSIMGPDVVGRRFLFDVRAHPGASNSVWLANGRLMARHEDEESVIADVSELSESVFPENYLAATAAALAAGVTPLAIGRAITSFRAPPNRLELIGVAHDVRVYSDGMAQTPRKVQAGLSRFPDRSLVVVAGGYMGVPTESLHGELEEREMLASAAATLTRKARHAVLVGDAAPTLRDALLAEGMDDACIHETSSSREAGALAGQLAKAGNNVVLSPVFYIPEAEWDPLCQAALEEVRRRANAAD